MIYNSFPTKYTIEKEERKWCTHKQNAHLQANIFQKPYNNDATIVYQVKNEWTPTNQHTYSLIQTQAWLRVHRNKLKHTLPPVWNRHTAIMLWRMLSGCCCCVVMLFESLLTQQNKKIKIKKKLVTRWQGSAPVSLSLTLFFSSLHCFTRYSSPPSLPCQSLITPCLSFFTRLNLFYLSLPLSLMNVIVSASCHFVCCLSHPLSLFATLLKD